MSTETVATANATANGTVEVKRGMSTVADLAAGYLTIEKGNGVRKWRWAKQLAEHLNGLASNKDRTSVSNEIGSLIPQVNKPGKFYSGSWVRQHAAAYAKFPNEPKTLEEAYAFLQAANGNAARAAKQEDAEDTSDDDAETGKESSTGKDTDWIGLVRTAVANAHKHGCETKDIMSAVREALGIKTASK